MLSVLTRANMAGSKRVVVDRPSTDRVRVIVLEVDGGDDPDERSVECVAEALRGHITEGRGRGFDELASSVTALVSSERVLECNRRESCSPPEHELDGRQLQNRMTRGG
jgi:hypothetical protein